MYSTDQLQSIHIFKIIDFKVIPLELDIVTFIEKDK